MVNSGKSRVIIERETYADLVAKNRPLHGPYDHCAG
jgi:hypothetical protein